MMKAQTGSAPAESFSDITQELPPLPPIPDIPPPTLLDSVPMGNLDSAPEVALDLTIAPGPFEPTWESIARNYPGVPAWLREAKFGIWVHFGPQAAGESGDWYARKMYTPGTLAYEKHLERYGHPSEVGYKEVLHDWNPTALDPSALVKIYQDAGARFLIIQGVHHDQFDMWNSRYQPWNAVRLGPKRDLLAEWVGAARSAGMRYGVTFHHEYSWWWWQTAFMADTSGPRAGVPYDGHLTMADGNGKWWEGMDPRMLYGLDLREYQGMEAAAVSPWSPPPAGLFRRHAAYAEWYATWWALRMMDVVQNYEPDFIYTDGTSTQPFSGGGTGTGIKADAMQRVIADYYNRTLARRGKLDVFSIVKFRPPTNGTVNTEEFAVPREIKTNQPWIGEVQAGDWFYRPGFDYTAVSVIRYIIEAAARDGSAAICICLKPDGSLDDGSASILAEVGRWMRSNGEAIYGSRAWSIPGEGQVDANGDLLMIPGGALRAAQSEVPFDTTDFRFTVGAGGQLYAICLAVPQPGGVVTIKSFGTSSGLVDKPIESVRLLGADGQKLRWTQLSEGLQITFPATPSSTAVVFEIR